MHVPKSAGTSIRTALEQALAPGSVAPKYQDRNLLCGFEDLDALDADIRGRLAVDPDEIGAMAHHPVVSGHFTLSTLLQITTPSLVATVLREPRARLLSNFTYWRLSTGLRKLWRGYPPLDHALRPLNEFLAEPQVAQATDNLVCRMLLDGDPRIPPLDFITDPEAIATDAIEVLGTLGFVGVVELQRSMWDGLSSFFGMPLSAMTVNTTASESYDADVPALSGAVTSETLELIDRRVAADAIVYRHVLREAGCSDREIEQIGSAAFADELVRLGDLAAGSGTDARRLARELDGLRRRHDEESRRNQIAVSELEQALQATRVELSRHAAWLEALQASASWRLTQPARAAKRRLKSLRASGRPSP